MNSFYFKTKNTTLIGLADQWRDGGGGGSFDIYWLTIAIVKHALKRDRESDALGAVRTQCKSASNLQRASK